ncbi:hypothetical protein GCM10011378_07670 [Hymenobacter glacieicola]|uniref:histidine kinase n=1 Tax=Hymenobacter glacieicola TaxID=1562124 RepID=A0ABQ1WJX6_9BACT|nr:hypothetical protein GCM10011378_07670 [Hymenobacter glacieicola]
MVDNLLSNSLKYHQPDPAPHVTIRCQAQGGHEVLAVQDNELGLDVSQSRNELFAVFQRLHTHVEGAELGLYMVKKIVGNLGTYRGRKPAWARHHISRVFPTLKPDLTHGAVLSPA